MGFLLLVVLTACSRSSAGGGAGDGSSSTQGGSGSGGSGSSGGSASSGSSGAGAGGSDGGGGGIDASTALLGDISFYTADAVAAFCDRYDRVYGAVTIMSSGITDEQDFSCLLEVHGPLNVIGTAWTRWHLPNLRRVYGDLQITDHEDLASVEFGSELTLDGALIMTRLPGLAAVDASRLMTRGSIQLSEIPLLPSFTLAHGEPATGRVDFTNLAGMETIDLSGIQMKVDRLDLRGMPSLVSLDGAGLWGTPDTVSINLEPQPDSSVQVDLPGLTEMGRTSISLGEGAELGLDGVRVVHGDLIFWLMELPSLPNLTDIDGDLQIESTKLIDLDELSSVRTIGESLMVSYNDSLVSISGLHGVTRVGGRLEIYSNESLPRGAPRALVDAIGEENIGGSIYASDYLP